MSCWSKKGQLVLENTLSTLPQLKHVLTRALLKRGDKAIVEIGVGDPLERLRWGAPPVISEELLQQMVLTPEGWDFMRAERVFPDLWVWRHYPSLRYLKLARDHPEFRRQVMHVLQQLRLNNQVILDPETGKLWGLPIWYRDDFSWFIHDLLDSEGKVTKLEWRSPEGLQCEVDAKGPELSGLVELLEGPEALLPETQHPATRMSLIIDEQEMFERPLVTMGSAVDGAVHRILRIWDSEEQHELLDIGTDESFVVPVTRYGVGSGGIFHREVTDWQGVAKPRTHCGFYYWLERRSFLGLLCRRWEHFSTKLAAARHFYRLARHDIQFQGVARELFQAFRLVVPHFLGLFLQTWLREISDDATLVETIDQEVGNLMWDRVKLNSSTNSSWLLWKPDKDWPAPMDPLISSTIEAYQHTIPFILDENVQEQVLDFLLDRLLDDAQSSVVFDSFGFRPQTMVKMDGEYIGRAVEAIEDEFDEPICQAMRAFNVDLCVFENVAGHYRTNGEVLDSRPDSFDWLVNLEFV